MDKWWSNPPHCYLASGRRKTHENLGSFNTYNSCLPDTIFTELLNLIFPLAVMCLLSVKNCGDITTNPCI
jgi:hypothetical protein